MEDTNNILNQIGGLIEVLIRQWRIILIAILITSFTSGFVSEIVPKTYESSVLIATTKIASSVSFGSTIQTLSDAQALAAGTASLADKQARIQSYVQMVKSPSVAHTVLDELGERLNPGDRNVSKLLNMVSGQVATNSDSIQISVVYPNAQLAADIANAWAKAYVDQVNAVYSEGGTLESYNAVKDQLTAAKDAYGNAQAALESFTAQDQEDNLQRMIDENQSEIDNLSMGYTKVISSVVDLQTQASMVAYEQKITDLTTQLQDKYDERRLVDKNLADAQDMYAQVQKGGDGAVASNTLALNLLKAQIFAANGDLGNIIIQSNPVLVSAEAMLSDLNSMIEVLKARQQSLDGEIQNLSTSISTPQGGTLDLALGQQARAAIQNFSNSVSYAQGDNNNTPRETRILALEDTTNQLNAQLLKAQSQKNELTRARDLAWDTYKNLATKATELEVTTKTENTTVALAAPAAVPDKDMTSTTKNVLLAVVAGLILGIIIAYAIEFWWAYKGVEPYPIATLSRRRDS